MKPLTGVRVLDLSRLLPGPFASLVLADLGAQVDKIEDAASGDYLRYFPPQTAAASAAYHTLNRGKRAAVLDLKNPAGKAAFERLVLGYDVLFEQFRPGVLQRLGLGHEELLKQHPKLIICALTGYGQEGPLRDRAGHDLNYLARAGVLGFQGPSAGPPQVPGFQMADISGGMWSVIAILAALRQRDHSGRGQVCDVAMTDGVMAFAGLAVSGGLHGATATPGDDVLSGGIAAYNTYIAKDGTRMTLAALEPKFWNRFVAATGIEADATALLPGPHQTALKARVAEAFAGRTRGEWLAFANEHDCCVEPVVDVDELASDPHVQARELLVEHAVGDEVLRHWRTPVTPLDAEFGPAAARGEHTEDIFAEAGFSAEEIAALRKSGALG